MLFVAIVELVRVEDEPASVMSLSDKIHLVVGHFRKSGCRCIQHRFQLRHAPFAVAQIRQLAALDGRRIDLKGATERSAGRYDDKPTIKEQ